jgi:hypothetical protein
MQHRNLLDITHQLEVPADAGQTRKILAGEIDTVSTDRRYVRRSGEVVWGHVTLSLVRDRRGKPDWFVVIVQDITARKNAEEELSRLHGQLWHADRAAQVGVLSASLAHELNQPLSAILTNAQAGLRFLAMENPDLEEIRTILQDIVHDDKRAGMVISGLRAMLRRRATLRERIPLIEPVKEVLGLLRTEMLDRRVRVALKTDASLVVTADRTQVQQVILNLLMNAVDAMRDEPDEPPQGGGHAGADGEGDGPGGGTGPRLRDPRRSAGEDVRGVLDLQGVGDGDRPRHLALHRGIARGPAMVREQPGGGGDLQLHPAPEGAWVGPRSYWAPSARRTSSASEEAPVLAMIRCRWTLTVFSLMPRSAAVSLFGQPLDDVGQDLTLPGREAAQPLLPLETGGIALHRLLHRPEQRVAVHGLEEEIHGPALHGVDARGDVAVSGEEDDGHGEASRRHPLEELGARHPRHADVQDHAGGPRRHRPLQQLAGGPERVHGVPAGGKDALQAAAHGGVVIHHEHNWQHGRTLPHGDGQW